MLRNLSPLPLDPWTASSLLQKAVRRGDADMATAAALRLADARGQAAVWRRLIIIAAEDVGIGSHDALILTASGIAQRRSITDGPRSLLHSVRELAQAPKCRAAEHVLTIGAEHPDWEDERQRVSPLRNSERVALAIDPSQPLPARAIAAWLASGVGPGRPPSAGSGDLAALMAGFGEAGLSPKFAKAVTTAARTVRDPMTVTLALVAVDLHQRREVPTIAPGSVQPSPICRGVPLYAFDKHTSLGKRAISVLLQENAGVRECLLDHAPEFRIRDLAEIAFFYAEGIELNAAATWSQTERLITTGIETALMRRGCSKAGVVSVMAVVRANLPHLNIIRERLFDVQPRDRQLTLQLSVEA